MLRIHREYYQAMLTHLHTPRNVCLSIIVYRATWLDVQCVLTIIRFILNCTLRTTIVKK